MGGLARCCRHRFDSFSRPFLILLSSLSLLSPLSLSKPVNLLSDRVFSLLALLRCPETFFISHEHANFLFSVFRVVQGQAKTPNIMGSCRAIFAFLHALKIGTFMENEH